MKFQIILIISINIIQILNGEENCPESNCKENSENFFCLSSLTQKDCETDGKYIVQYQSFCECCPGCRGGQPIYDPCTSSDACAPGLICDSSDLCVLDKSICSYTYHLKDIKLLPTCEIDGKFAAVQCKGDRITGRCFCYSENGKRIFGWSWWKDVKDMTCACSRLKYNLDIQGLNQNTLHCDEKGNFEQLQCTDGICWCANSTTGELWHNTRAVPESMWTFLPCYDMAKMGLKYLRQCESALNSQNLLRKALFAHGTTKMEFNNIKCDYDGAFGIYSNLNGITSCQWRDGSKLGSFQVASNLASKMNCNCGRDQKIFAEAGQQHRLTCGGNGNYESIQNINGKIFCVDSDGFAVNDAVETEILPNCTNFIYSEVVIPPPNTYDYKEYNEYKDSKENEYNNINEYYN